MSNGPSLIMLATGKISLLSCRSKYTDQDRRHLHVFFLWLLVQGLSNIEHPAWQFGRLDTTTSTISTHTHREYTEHTEQKSISSSSLHQVQPPFVEKTFFFLLAWAKKKTAWYLYYGYAPFFFRGFFFFFFFLLFCSSVYAMIVSSLSLLLLLLSYYCLVVFRFRRALAGPARTPFANPFLCFLLSFFFFYFFFLVFFSCFLPVRFHLPLPVARSSLSHLPSPPRHVPLPPRTANSTHTATR